MVDILVLRSVVLAERYRRISVESPRLEEHPLRQLRNKAPLQLVRIVVLEEGWGSESDLFCALRACLSSWRTSAPLCSSWGRFRPLDGKTTVSRLPRFPSYSCCLTAAFESSLRENKARREMHAKQDTNRNRPEKPITAGSQKMSSVTKEGAIVAGYPAIIQVFVAVSCCLEEGTCALSLEECSSHCPHVGGALCDTT